MPRITKPEVKVTGELMTKSPSGIRSVPPLREAIKAIALLKAVELSVVPSPTAPKSLML
jgi:hypothetical protein